MEERITKFVDVIVPLAVPNLYTYRVPRELNDDVGVGKRVLIQFGKRKVYSSIIRRIHQSAPKNYTAKYIDDIIDNIPIVGEIQLQLWEWIARYYICTIGEVMNAALPSGFKLASQSRIILNTDFKKENYPISDNEWLVLDALELREELELKDIQEITQLKNPFNIVKNLIDIGAVFVYEQVIDKYKSKKESYIQLNSAYYDNENQLKSLFEELERAPKQLDFLMSYLHQDSQKKLANKGIKKILFQKEINTSSSIINALVSKNIFSIYEKEIGRIEPFSGNITPIQALSPAQQKSLNSIQEHFKNKKHVLLHGVTGSGKTEVYIQLIQTALNQGKQVLYLLPEIALTTQIIQRLQRFFGNQVGVFHSKFNPNERVEIWNDLINPNGKYKIIVGARSAVFLPFHNLGLVIVDEEHDQSFKQMDPSPRYHAREVAFYLAKITNSNVLLGTATPSIEMYWNALEHHIELVELNERFGKATLPEIQCADIKEETKRKKMKSHFSEFLMEHIELALGLGEQVILFQNRRGYTPLWRCETCGWVPQCNHCDVSLTYHKSSHLLSCHYCGQSVKPHKTCQACGDHKLKMVGFGTEKIEEDLELFFPKAKIKRMDLDTTRSKYGYQRIIGDFENREIDILIGTQMVTKGLDFDNVNLVGILNADDMLNFPDYRAFERAFQLFCQVAGRAGRKEKRGKVIIQTFNPNHWVIQKVMQNDFKSLYNQEIIERKNFKYPPFYRMIKLTIKHKEKHKVDVASDLLSKYLLAKLPQRILGPEYPSIPRIKNYYLKNILIKYEKNLSQSKVKQFLIDQINELKSQKEFGSIIVNIDVEY